MSQQERDLLQQAKTYDQCALQVLMARWDRPMFDAAYRMLGDREEAADVRQQALLRMLQSLPRFNEQAALSTWLYRIVINLCRDRMRKKTVEQRAMTKLYDSGPRTPEAHRGDDPGDAAEIVSAAVLALPDDEREAVTLKHYAGLSFAEMADILEVPASTLKSRVLRALERLRTRLREVGCLVEL